MVNMKNIFLLLRGIKHLNSLIIVIHKTVSFTFIEVA